ncbi:MAG: MFS transporter [Myxococcaceae bacterium]|nr:MFS transporter [Myxococcaceae bacterium]MCI0670040.1 MFS transporter [Myxococcaceae bacterium]
MSPHARGGSPEVLAPESVRSPEVARSLPRTVLLLGVVSLLTDVSSEMIFTLLPAFLAATVGGAPVLLGAMEGVADLVSAGLKVQAGVWADRSRRLKPLVLLGYGISALARPWMAFITIWWQPLLIRVVDRTGKGLRGAPRDALIARAVPSGARGAAYGFHRGMDHAGAALGALVASGLLALGVSVPHVFLWAAVPGALAVGALSLVRESPPPQLDPRPQHSSLPLGEGQGEGAGQHPATLRHFLFPVGLFSLSRATDAFLLLLLTAQGAPPALLPLAWLLLHVAKAALSWPAGRLADRMGPVQVVLAGWVTYAVACGLLAVSPGVGVTLALLTVYGLYQALAEGAEKALLAELVPAEVRGRAFGLYHGLSGVMALGAGVWFGLVWQYVSPAMAWAVAGGVALAAAVMLRVMRPRLLRAV